LKHYLQVNLNIERKFKLNGFICKAFDIECVFYNILVTENAETPFMATISIGNIQYGTGIASGKKQAKNEAGNTWCCKL